MWLDAALNLLGKRLPDDLFDVNTAGENVGGPNSVRPISFDPLPRPRRVTMVIRLALPKPNFGEIVLALDDMTHHPGAIMHDSLV